MGAFAGSDGNPVNERVHTMPRDPMPDVIVLLPGITGSRLRHVERTLWGVAGTAIGRMLATRGASMCRDLSLF